MLIEFTIASGMNEPNVFSFVVFLTSNSKNISFVVFLIGIAVPVGLYAVVTAIPFVVHIGLFVVETAIPAIAFAVPTYES